MRTHFNPTKAFQYTYFSSCHLPAVKKGFIKGEAIRLLRTNSSKTTFEENIKHFKRRLRVRGYPVSLTDKSIQDVKHHELKSLGLTKEDEIAQENSIPFVTDTA